MKKLFVVGCLFLALVMFHLPSYAAQDVVTIVSETVLDDDPQSYTSDIIDIRRFSKAGFFIIYDETETGGGVECTVSLTYNPTTTVGDDVASAYFYDFAGGTTLQTSENITADGEYYFWIPVEFPVPFVQITVTGAALDANDYITLSIYVVGQV